MKKKIVVLVGITLCTMLLISPALASGVDTLGIYGNANEDDTIDMRDLTYVKLIFFGKKPETELADAKYDGKINPLDFIQIKLITVGKEKEITVVDSADRVVTVKKPVERIVSFSGNFVETMRSLNVDKDRIAGVDKSTIQKEIFFPEFSDYPNVGYMSTPDIEKVLSLNPDVVICYAWYIVDSPKSEAEKLLKTLEDAGIAAPCFYCYLPTIYAEEVEKLGYILGKKKEAGDFIEFYEGCLSTIKESVEEIPEDERPKVYYETFANPYRTIGKYGPYHEKIEMAGGNNLFGDLEVSYVTVEAEEVINRDPEIIIKNLWRGTGYDVDDPTELKNAVDEMISRPELAKVFAVKYKKVYAFSTDVTCGPRHFIGMGYFAKWFHPDIFKDLNPKAIHQEYLTTFQGLDYDLDKHGVFVYPEEPV